MAVFEYEQCAWCGGPVSIPSRDTYVYKRDCNGRKWFCRYSHMCAWDREHKEKKKKGAWYDMPEEDRKLLEDF